MRKSTLAKIVGIFLTLGACATAWAQTYSNAVMGLNPAAYWPLNETVQPPQILNLTATNDGTLGAAANGYYGAWYQASGNQWYLTNNIVTETGPIAGGDVALNCQYQPGQYIVLPRNTNGVANSALTIKPPFSIECWINPGYTGGHAANLISEGENSVNAGNTNSAFPFLPGKSNTNYWAGFVLGQYDNFLYFDCFETNTYNNKNNELDSPSTLTVGKWVYVVCTYDGTQEIIYTNGVEAKSKTIGANGAGVTYVADLTSPLMIGSGPDVPESYGTAWWGGLSEVAIYNQALNGTQVQNHYQATSSVASYTNTVLGDNPILYFRMNEGQTQTNAGYPSTTFPVANNYGSLGAVANGAYQPGTTPGVSGPSYPGFGAHSKSVSINGWLGAVDVGSSNIPSALNPTGAVPLTVVSWFQTGPADAPGRYQEILGHSDNSYRLAIGQVAAENHFNPGPGPELAYTTQSQVATNGFAFNDGQWHMVAGVSDGTNEYLYLDGDLCLSSNNPAGIKIIGSADDLLLGGDPEYTYANYSGGPYNTIRNFDGQIAQVAFWTNALTAAQIQSLYGAAGVPLFIYHEPVSSVTANQGQNVTISSGIRGSDPIYQWYQNGVAVAGQTNANLTYSPILSSDAGSYYVIASNSFGSVTSSVVNVTVYGTVFIMSQTAPQLEIFSNSSPTLYVTASGQSPTYQWTVGSVAIPGATNDIYTVTDIQTNSVYGCVLTNSLSTNHITPISITVPADPTNPYPAQVLANHPLAYYRLDEAPGALTAYDYVGGFNAEYTNVVTGDVPNPGPYAPLSDPNEASALFGYGNVPDNNYAGNVPGYLNFAEPNGSNAEFSVEAWIFNTGSGDNDCIVGMGYGGGGEQFVLDDGASTSGALRFFVRNSAGTVSSANSTNVVENDGNWHHVVAVCDEAGGNVYLYLDGTRVANATITPGSGLMEMTTPLTIGARESADNSPADYDAQYNGYIDDVAIYNKALTPAQIRTDYNAVGFVPLNVQVLPSSWTTNSGASATFTATVGSGTQPFSYQWYDINNNPISGQTNAILVLSNLQSTESGTYTVTVANQYASANGTFTLQVNNGPAQIPAGGDIQPTNVVVYEDSPVTLTINPSGSLPFDCQWYQNGVAVPGATNISFGFAALLGTNTYYCSVSNAYSYSEGSGPVFSSTATVVGEAGTLLNPSSFNSRLKIAFTGYTNAETLQCFPALVRFGTNLTGFSYGEFLAPNGADLRFADSSGTRELPYEVEQWNGSNGVSSVWVQVPYLSNSTNFIWAYWGNANDTTPPAYTTNGAVWEPASFLDLPGYDVVYHLQETNFPYVDSTTNYPALDGVAPSVAPGIVGNGALFNGSYLDAGNVNLGNQFTESAWVNLTPNEYNIQGLWCNGPGGFSTAEAVLFINDYYPQSGVTSPTDGALLFGDNGSQPETTTGLITSNQWYLVTAAVNRTAQTIRFYVNGVPESEAKGGSVTATFPTNADMNLGRFLPNTANPNGSSFFTGIMDEARIHGGIDDSNWVWADYMTVASNSVFTTYSTVTNTVVLPITLTIQVSGGHVILNWPDGTLQSASQVNGPYSNVSGATSPYTNTVSGQQFYRVQAQF